MVQYGIPEDSFWYSLVGLFLLFILFRTLVVVCLLLQEKGDDKKSAGDTRNTNIPTVAKKALAEVIEEVDD